MGMDVGEQSGSLSSPNIVPLIDILLVLIIIFMVITPLIPKGLDTLVPQPNPNQKQDVELENKTVVVQVSKDGKVKINQDDSNWEQLRHCPGDTRVTFGLFACIEEGGIVDHGLDRVSPKGVAHRAYVS